MTTTPIEVPEPKVQPPKRKGARLAIAIIGGALLLLAGVGIGAASKAPKPVTLTKIKTVTVTVTTTPAPAPTVTVTAKPAAPAKAGVVLYMSGNGIKNSSPIRVTSGTLTAYYSYNCASAGGTGNFIADLETPNQGAANSDDQSIANALGSGGTASTTIYPQDVGSQYYLAVNSECNWSVTIKSP
jgi:hypothetical protein